MAFVFDEEENPPWAGDAFEKKEINSNSKADSVNAVSAIEEVSPGEE
jgi:hypothetical protein